MSHRHVFPVSWIRWAMVFMCAHYTEIQLVTFLHVIHFISYHLSAVSINKALYIYIYIYIYKVQFNYASLYTICCLQWLCKSNVEWFVNYSLDACVCVCVLYGDCVCVCVHEKALWPSDSHQAIIIGWAESQWQRDLPRILMSTAGQHTYTHLACTCSVWSLSYLIFCIRKKTRWTQDGCHMDVLSGCRRVHFTSSGEQTHHSLHMLN